MVASIGGGKSVKPDQFAPWLDWGEEKQEEVPFEITLEGRIMDEIIRRDVEAREVD